MRVAAFMLLVLNLSALLPLVLNLMAGAVLTLVDVRSFLLG